MDNEKKKWTDADVTELMSTIRSGAKQKKRWEMSKIILIIVTVISGSLILFGMALAWYRSDSSILKIMASGTVSTQATATAFYFWKAKQENVLKLKAIYKDEFIAIEEAKSRYYAPSVNDFNADFGNDGRDISNGV